VYWNTKPQNRHFIFVQLSVIRTDVHGDRKKIKICKKSQSNPNEKIMDDMPRHTLQQNPKTPDTQCGNSVAHATAKPTTPQNAWRK